MPFVEIFTRERLPDEARGTLAEALTTTMIEIEVGEVTDDAREISLIWFHTLGETGWVTGGRLDDRYRKSRKFALARIITPEAFLTPELKQRAIREVTTHLREALGAGPEDDGKGIWVLVIEVPEGQWGAGGEVIRLADVIRTMRGTVSPERRAGMDRHFEGYAAMKAQFGIPD